MDRIRIRDTATRIFGGTDQADNFDVAELAGDECLGEAGANTCKVLPVLQFSHANLKTVALAIHKKTLIHFLESSKGCILTSDLKGKNTDQGSKQKVSLLFLHSLIILDK